MELDDFLMFFLFVIVDLADNEIKSIGHSQFAAIFDLKMVVKNVS